MAARAGRRWASIAIAAACAVPLGGAPAMAAVPSGFQERVVLSGLDFPTNVEFSPDGRVFVAEKRGVVLVFDSLQDTSPDVFADLRTETYNQWDRGLLGLALHPAFPGTPYVYASYSRDAAPGGPAPRWGVAGGDSDDCPTPPGATTDGCVSSGRIVRLAATGNAAVETVTLVDGFCQQFPSHAVGDLVFGADGALYASAGDGASFDFVDYGQKGIPTNPCGDPGAAVGGAPTPPSAEGGALRSQDLRTAADPTGLDGTILRIDALTGAALPDNPLAAAADPNARRIVAHGLRNPFRFAVRPGTNEIWVGEVGWDGFEEVNRVVPGDPVENFGWPCYEGAGRQGGYDAADLALCEGLYATAAAHTPPVFAYAHGASFVPGDGCSVDTSSTSGVAFYAGGTYPAAYAGTLFLADYSRSCIWAVPAGPGGLPDFARRFSFVSGASAPVDLEVGPGGDLYYVDIAGGTVRRVSFFHDNVPPLARLTADPPSGALPLTVAFDASATEDPDPGDVVTFAWDLDGDGEFDDGTGATASWRYTTPAPVVASVRATDSEGASDVASFTVRPGEAAPSVQIVAPTADRAWAVGERIEFAGSAVDPQEGPLAAGRLTWSVILHHCGAASCHEHAVQQFAGVAGGSFAAPDHAYPSHLELRLTATDAAGLSATASVALQPRTVELAVSSVPAGLVLALDGVATPGPFARTAIVGSAHTIGAPVEQALENVLYRFSSWSDGGAATHDVVAAGASAFVATYAGPAALPAGPGGPVPAARSRVTRRWLAADADRRIVPGTLQLADRARRLTLGGPDRGRALVSFRVGRLAGAPQSATLRLFVVSAGASRMRVRRVSGPWSELRLDPGRLETSDPRRGVIARVGRRGWLEVDVTSLLTRGGRATFALEALGGDVVLASRETRRGAPRLVIAPG